ncbi:uncharacterized protein LOC119316018 isoform X2 [Triticum dicoccoides]|uniref:uncharacterized protein LOC119316018 isoform X2 n=1 Tax=Triticum dicoccoides TaxID=85692 RepID=UPI00188F2EB1|nr:uncharacterized protein LOC119316018 isoform X2 [Triticum dicoccoides]
MLRAGGGVTTTTYQTRRGAVNENVGLEIQNIQEVVGELVLNRRQACWRTCGRIGEHPLHVQHQLSIFRLTILKRTCRTPLIQTMIHSWSDLQTAICSPNVASC